MDVGPKQGCLAVSLEASARFPYHQTSLALASDLGYILKPHEAPQAGSQGSQWMRGTALHVMIFWVLLCLKKSTAVFQRMSFTLDLGLSSKPV